MEVRSDMEDYWLLMWQLRAIFWK